MGKNGAQRVKEHRERKKTGTPAKGFKSKRRISHKGARAKGHNFEREVASMMRERGFLKAIRQLEYQANIVNGTDLNGTGPFRIQCKNLIDYASVNTINEVRDKSGFAVLVTKGLNLPAMAVVDLNLFLFMAEDFMRGMSKEKQEEHGWVDPRKIDLGF